MKYFFFLLIFLLAIGYKVASENNESLTSDNGSYEEEPVREVKKIDLRKIKIKTSSLTEESSGEAEGPRPDISDPLPEPGDDSYSDNYGEMNEALNEAKFSGSNDEKKYQPEMNNDHEDLIREELRKRNK